jgi:hypothetical protein
MIRYLRHDEIDKSKWDACCTKAGDKFWFYNTWFLDLVSPCWHGMVSENYEAIMALPSKKKFGISYCIQPFMMPQGGVVSGEKLYTDDIHAFVSEIPIQYKYINLRLNVSNIAFKDEMIQSIRKNHYVNLNLPYDQLRKHYSERVKVNMKTAVKSGNSVIECTDDSFFIPYYKQYSEWLTPSQKNTHIDLIQKCLEDKKGQMLLTQTESKEITSGVFFFKERNQIVVVIAFSSLKGKETCSMNLLYDHIISTYAGSDCEIDFTGSSMPGVAHFLEGFGAIPDDYPQILINHLPWYIKILKNN